LRLDDWRLAGICRIQIDDDQLAMIDRCQPFAEIKRDVHCALDRQVANKKRSGAARERFLTFAASERLVVVARRLPPS